MSTLLQRKAQRRHLLALLTEDLMSWSSRGPNVEYGNSDLAQEVKFETRLRGVQRKVHEPMDRMRAEPGGITSYCIECSCGEYVTFESTSYRDVRQEYINHRSVRQERERKAGKR